MSAGVTVPVQWLDCHLYAKANRNGKERDHEEDHRSVDSMDVDDYPDDMGAVQGEEQDDDDSEAPRRNKKTTTRTAPKKTTSKMTKGTTSKAKGKTSTSKGAAKKLVSHAFSISDLQNSHGLFFLITSSATRTMMRMRTKSTT